jgi:predicted TIM-barrel fold metal-dependent hydrolase
MNTKVHKPSMLGKDLGEFRGKVLDTDSHVYLPPHLIKELIGDEVGMSFAYDFLSRYYGTPEYLEHRAKAREEIWDVKGIAALGADTETDSDCTERLEMLEKTGVRAQFVFPNTNSVEMRVDSDAARAACRRYNDHLLWWAKPGQGRLRPAMQINMTRVDWAIEELDRVLNAGAKLVVLPCAAPPAGVSPAHSIWDPFWARLEEAQVPATIHIGSGGIPTSSDDDPVMPPRGFANAESMKGFFAERVGGEEAIGPYFVMTSHLQAQLFVSSLVMGKVFERFPRLMVGVYEFGAFWLGPMAELLDQHAGLMAKVGYPYKEKPSDYLRRNVRVGPFFHENLPLLTDRYGLEECYTFMTDYPHLEGGRDPFGKAFSYTENMSKGFREQYLVGNARSLFPDLV